MRFVDEARLKIKAGDGGPGIVAWRREKFVPHGGPAGGDGGKGGDVIFMAHQGRNSLLDLKKETLIKAQNGKAGQSKNKTGHYGEDKLVYVPVGTSIWECFTDSEEKVLLADLTHEGDRVVVGEGGDGGLGNARFKSSSCHSPEKATPGFKGEEKELLLSLKLMADVGLLGFPNAGKSTLLRRLSNAKPKVGDYPFTTLKPMVGVCEVDINRTMVIADIPGLIEGASEGAGLGFRFLRHLERVRVLCHLIDCSIEDDLIERFNIINNELKSYSNELHTLPQIVAINKVDSNNSQEEVENFISFLKKKNINSYLISAVTGQGLDILKEALYSISIKNPSKKEFNPLNNLY